jgi:hypothetical protein
MKCFPGLIAILWIKVMLLDFKPELIRSDSEQILKSETFKYFVGIFRHYIWPFRCFCLQKQIQHIEVRGDIHPCLERNWNPAIPVFEPTKIIRDLLHEAIKQILPLLPCRIRLSGLFPIQN